MKINSTTFISESPCTGFYTPTFTSISNATLFKFVSIIKTEGLEVKS
jgi:hypothetical protein